MANYNLTKTKFAEPATIGGTAYTVTGYTNNGIAPVLINLSNQNGTYKEPIMKNGPRTGTITIECASSTEATPAQATTFTYPATGSINWLITQVSETLALTAAATYNLSLQEATGSAI